MSSNQQSGKKKMERVITKEKRVPAKVIVGEIPAIDFKPPQAHLKGAVTVIVSNGQMTRSWTIHHPIGVTDLDPKDWVISDSTDVPVMLAHRTDDDAPRKAQLRAKFREELAKKSDKPMLTEDPEGVTTYPTGRRRADVIKKARERAADEYDAAKIKWKKAGARKDEEPKLGSYLDYMNSKDERQAERAFLAFCDAEDTKEKVLVKYPESFRTRFGPKLDRDQESSGVPGFYTTPGQAFDAICYQIESMEIAPKDVILAERDGQDIEHLRALPVVRPDELKDVEEDSTPPPDGDDEDSVYVASDHEDTKV